MSRENLLYKGFDFFGLIFLANCGGRILLCGMDAEGGARGEILEVDNSPASSTTALQTQ